MAAFLFFVLIKNGENKVSCVIKRRIKLAKQVVGC